MSYAVIDVGTNTLILLIAKVKGKKIEVVHDEARITRLGQQLSENHYFLSEAMNRTKKALKEFKEKCAEHKVKKIMVVGTAACRIAANTDVFSEAVKKELGLKINVITGKQEAEYTFLSAWKDFGEKDKKILVVDIGGGSTEIITGPINSKKQVPETVISLPFGSVRLTEQFIKHDPISEDEFTRLLQDIRNNLKDELDGFYPEGFDPEAHTMIATAGTATTLLSLARKLKTYDAEKVHGGTLSKAHLEKLVTEMAQMSIAQRQKLPGMEPLRADVIVAGGLLLNEIMRFFKQKETLISDRGLRYGVFLKNFVK